MNGTILICKMYLYKVLFHLLVYLLSMKKILTCITIALLLSCSSSQKKVLSYDLVETDTTIEFELDEHTTNCVNAFQIYEDKHDGIEYLVFQNDINPRLLFYNMKSGKFVKEAKYSLLGPEGIPKFGGFKIRTKDEIYLTDLSFQGISVVDWNGRLKKRIPTKRFGDGKHLYVLMGYLTYTLVGDSLFCCLAIDQANDVDNRLKNSPLCGVVNLKNDEIKTLPFSYFDMTQKEDEGYIVIYYARCFDGKRFIYSITQSDNLYVCDISHEHVKKITTKCKYWSHREIPLQRFNSRTRRQILEAGEYGILYYDQYRDVYYRIIYPPCKLDPNVNLSDISNYGRGLFDIVILDKDFRIVGEKRMPENKYCSRPLYIREDGVYLSESYPLNPDFDENKLTLRKFDLVSNE